MDLQVKPYIRRLRLPGFWSAPLSQEPASLLLVAVGGSSVVRGIFLQDSGDVGEVVEHLEDLVNVFRRSTVDHQVEDVEVAWFCLQVPPQRLIVGQAPVHVVRQADGPRLREDLALGGAVLAGFRGSSAQQPRRIARRRKRGRPCGGAPRHGAGTTVPIGPGGGAGRAYREGGK